MQERQQIRLAARSGPEILPAQLPRQRHQRDEHQADRGQMPKPGEIVGAVRIDDGDSLRQFHVGLVMVDHHGIEAELRCFGERFDAGGAAIDGDEQFDAAFGKGADGVYVRSVALENPVGNMHDRIEPAVAQIARQQRRRGGAVHVVIPENRHAFVRDNGMREARRGGLHAGQLVRIGHQPLDAGIEIGRNLIGLDAAARQNARQQFRHAGALRDGERTRLSALVQAVAPRASGRRFLHAEEIPLGGVRRRCRQCRHRHTTRSIGADEKRSSVGQPR